MLGSLLAWLVDAWADDGLDLVGLEQAGKVGKGHRGAGQLVAVLLSTGHAVGAEDGVQTLHEQGSILVTYMRMIQGDTLISKITRTYKCSTLKALWDQTTRRPR